MTGPSVAGSTTRLADRRNYLFNEGFISLVETPDGDFITMSPVSDEVPFPDVPYSDIWVMRLDNRGEIIWQKILGGPKMDYGMDMLLTREGHLFVCGSFVDPSVDDSDAWVLKLDSDGAVIWQKRYGGEEEDEACAILQAEDEGFWVLGSTRSYGEEGLEPWIMKLDDSGEVVQQKVFHGAFEFLAGGLAPSPDGGIIVSGTIKTEHFTPQDAVAIRLDGAGSIVWKKMYAAPGNDSTGMLRPAIDGGLIMAGNSSSFGEGIDGIILKLDLDGNIIWQRSYGTPGPDYIRSIRATQDGGCIIGASSFFFYHKTWIMKVNDLGLIPGECPAGIGAETFFEVSEADLTTAETDAVPVETDAVPVDTSVIPTDPGPVEFETQCVGW